MEKRFEKQKEKISLIAILLAGSCFSTYYFHKVIETGTVFTHFFYIPIIIASVWWKRKGLIVALFLGAVLIVSHLTFRADVSAINDYLRMLMFIVVAFVIVCLSKQIAKSDEEIRKNRDYLEELVSERSAQVVKINEQLKQQITERKKAEEALQQSEDRYRTIFESTGTATITSDEDMTILMVNLEFENLSGYSKKEIEGKKSWTEFVLKDDLERLKEYHTLRRVDPAAAPRNHEFRFLDRHGNIRHIFATAAMIPGTKKGVASFSDITENKRAEEERLTRKKLEGVLEMAGAACHELNQPLMSVSANCELLMMDMEESNPYYERAKIINEQVDRMADITRKIMKIRKYETMKYIDGKIVDIDRASK